VVKLRAAGGSRHVGSDSQAFHNFDGMVEQVRTEARGEPGTPSFRLFFVDSSGRDISPWHDLPLATSVDSEHWMVVEVPKGTTRKMEVATSEFANPIAQDTLQGGRLREYLEPMSWNYGFLPRTWEDPTALHPKLRISGDDDPLDVVEIGGGAHIVGSLVRVRVLGALALVDCGELDWKIIAIAVDDALMPGLEDIADVEGRLPSILPEIREWFRCYKTADGRPPNTFAFGEAALGRVEALEVIGEAHRAWEQLIRGDVRTALWTRAPQPSSGPPCSV